MQTKDKHILTDGEVLDAVVNDSLLSLKYKSILVELTLNYIGSCKIYTCFVRKKVLPLYLFLAYLNLKYHKYYENIRKLQEISQVYRD